MAESVFWGAVAGAAIGAWILDSERSNGDLWALACAAFGAVIGGICAWAGV